MRILLVSDLFPPVVGGLEFHVDALAAELARRGDDVRVATLTADPVPACDAVVAAPVRSLAPRLPHERADRPFHPPVPEPVTRAALGRLIAGFRPDVVHAHSAMVASLPRRSGRPVVFTAHDYGTVCQVRTLLRPDGAVCTGPALAKCVSCGTGRYGAAKSTLLTLGTRHLRRRLPADRVLAVSDAVRAALEPWLRVPVSVVPNFVGDEPAAEPLPAEVPETGFALYAGDPGEHKGVPDLLDAWRAHGDTLPPLVLATPRPVDVPLPRGVVPVRLTRGQVAAAWRRAAVAVVPSRWPDPCPTVVLEALRAGVPVVGTPLGGIPELVRDGVEGVLVPPRDPAALAAAVAGLTADPARRERLGRAARERAGGYSVAAVTTRVRDVYAELSGAAS